MPLLDKVHAFSWRQAFDRMNGQERQIMALTKPPQNAELVLHDHHIQPLERIAREVGTDTIHVAGIWALAYACCHAKEVIQFASANHNYADAEDLDISMVVTARIAEANAKRKKRRTA